MTADDRLGPCPRCGAAAGEPCVTASGAPARNPHKGRSALPAETVAAPVAPAAPAEPAAEPAPAPAAPAAPVRDFTPFRVRTQLAVALLGVVGAVLVCWSGYRLTRAEGVEILVATASDKGTFYPVGKGFARLLRTVNGPLITGAKAEITRGSGHNLELLAEEPT